MNWEQIIDRSELKLNNDFVYDIEVASYFLWEYSKCNDALSMWYCAEDIARYFKMNDIFSIEVLSKIIKKGIYNLDYINFVRNVAFRIYVFTNNSDDIFNWMIAEKLINNMEWCASITRAAYMYKSKFDTKKQKMF